MVKLFKRNKKIKDEFYTLSIMYQKDYSNHIRKILNIVDGLSDLCINYKDWITTEVNDMWHIRVPLVDKPILNELYANEYGNGLDGETKDDIKLLIRRNKIKKIKENINGKKTSKSLQ
jgi:hypothetical protein